MGNKTAPIVFWKGSVHIQDGILNDVLYVPSLSANHLSISQITHSGSGKTIEFATDSVFIQNTARRGLISRGTVDHTTRLYTFSYFGPPSPLSEHNYSLPREHHVVQSGHLNFCIVLEIPFLTTTPHPVEAFSLQHDTSSALPEPPVPFIESLGALVEDSTEDIHILLHDSISTPTLGIPFPDPHVFSFEHQLGLLVIQGFPCFVPLFLSHWSIFPLSWGDWLYLWF